MLRKLLCLPVVLAILAAATVTVAESSDAVTTSRHTITPAIGT